MISGEAMDQRRKWHIDKGVNPAYVVLLITAIWGVILWAGKVNSDQSVQDLQIKTVEKKMDDYTRTNREDIQEINRKLDRLLERGK